MTENLSYQSFSTISAHRAAEFLCRRNAQPARGELVGPDKQRAVAAVNSRAGFINFLKIGVPAKPLARAKFQQPVRYSLLTVRRFRPLARRRFSTRRPFFVLMRTRNPCVRLRRRVFG